MPSEKFRRLRSYKGRLTVSQAAAGISVAIANARQLADDAELLRDHGRWPRASSLAILAIEEAGKIPLIRHLLLVESDSDIERLWKDYRSHTKKNVMGAFLDHVTPSPRIEDFRPLFDATSDHPQRIDALKQLSFYSDCLSDCRWSAPSEVIDESTAISLCLIARLSAPAHDGPMTSAEELELWVKHLKPAWGSDMSQMKKAVQNCFSDAAKRGVLRGKIDVADIAEFLS